MVKQTKTFKKGNVTKKALSAILAASMVMTSSSFVMAAPVEVEDVAVEAAAVDVVEDVDAGEENVGADYKVEESGITVDDLACEYTGEAVKPVVSIVDTDGFTLKENKDYTLYCTDNINATTDEKKATVSITFIGDYAANAPQTKEFRIAPASVSSAVVVSGTQTEFVYDGTVQHPSVSSVKVTLNGKEVTLTEGTDYELVCKKGSTEDGKSVGTQSLFVKGIGNFGDEKKVTDYEIQNRALKQSDVTITTLAVAFADSSDVAQVKKAIKVKDVNTNAALTEYDVYFEQKDGSWKKDTAVAEVGTHKFRIVPNGSGNYGAGNAAKGTGVAEGTYEVVASKTVAMYVEGKEFTYDYNGTNHFNKANIKNKIDATGFVEGTNYKIVNDDKTDWTNAGEYTVEIEGINNFSGTATIPVKVAPKALNDTKTALKTGIKVKATAGTTHSGNVSAVSVEVEDGTTKLEDGKDYTYTTEKRGNDTYVIITGKGNYTTETPDKKVTTYEKKVDVATTLDINDASISAKVKTAFTYNGKAITVDYADLEVVENDSTAYALEARKDYTIIAVKGAEGAGEASVTIRGYGKYAGTREIKFEIAGKAFSDDFTMDAIKDVEKTKFDVANYQDPSDVTVRYKNGGAKLSNSKYTVALYFDGKEVKTPFKTKTGTYTVKVTPVKGQLPQYAGTVETSFEVIGDSLATATISDIADQNWTGSAIEPTVKVTLAGKELVKDKEYKVSYTNNVKTGVANVIVEGIGDYSGKVVKPFNIVGEMDQKIEVLAAQERDLGNGTRTLNSKATKIKYTTAPETDVTYTSSDENVVTVDAEGNIKYTGIGEATITIEAKAENGYKVAKKEVKVVVTLAKPSFTPFSKNNAFTLTSSTVKGAEKFEVEYATKKDFSNSKTKTFETTSAGKVRQVKVSAADKKTYYVRVRAISGTTKSAWSTVKTVATK